MTIYYTDLQNAYFGHGSGNNKIFRPYLSLVYFIDTKKIIMLFFVCGALSRG